MSVLTEKSKFMSWVLRHGAKEVELDMDDQGYVDVVQFLSLCCARRQGPDSFTELQEIVATSDKQRFGFTANNTRVRCNQGHSLEMYLDFAAYTPTGPLYHGTCVDVVESICRNGIQRMTRRYVHLSQDLPTAKQVGSRHTGPGNELVVFVINTRATQDLGHKFNVSDNHVVLVDTVPPACLGRLLWFHGENGTNMDKYAEMFERRHLPGT